MKQILCVVLLTLLSVTFAEKARYDNYRVYKVTPDNEGHVEKLRALEHSGQEYDFWRSAGPGLTPAHVMVPPHKLATFHEFLQEHRFHYSISVANVQQLIDDEAEKLKMRPKTVEWTNYHNLSEYNSWLDDLVSQFPGIVSLVPVGQSFEGNEVRALRINFADSNPGVYLESGMHAGEWLGPAMASWLVNTALTSDSASLWTNFNYLWVPIVNPDGYNYSWTGDRMWRKTRQPYQTTQGPCYGADPNRNWNHHWMESGATDFPCDSSFAGSAPESEVEIRNLRVFLEQEGPSHDIMLAFHTFGQMLMFPWGYTAEHTAHHDLWMRIAGTAVNDLGLVHGTRYIYGTVNEVIYTTSGSSMEWYYGAFNNTIAMVFEGRDEGETGVLLPPEQITPSCEEVQAAVERILTEYLALRK